MTTVVPVLQINEGQEEFKLWCEWCDACEVPHREFLSEYRDVRYEDARCPRCNKQIAGLVVKLAHNRRAGDEGG